MRGENLGESNLYGDHQTADHPTTRVPWIMAHPSLGAPRVERGLHYQFDLGATVLQMLLPPLALYDVVADPHQTRDLAAERPEVVADGLARLESWTAAQRARNPEGEDPMETVIAEGGPSLARGHEDAYEARLRATGRADQVARMRASARAFVN